MRRTRLRAAGKYAGLGLAAALCALSPVACGPPDAGVDATRYLPRNAHEAYGHSLAQSGLVQAALGRDWIAAAEQALFEPDEIEVPFEAAGRFDPASPSALGFRFSVGAGRRLKVELELDSKAPARVFVDLFELGTGTPSRVASAPPSARSELSPRTVELDVLDAADYVLRVQPELLRGGDFRVSIESGPLLAFPVEGHGVRSIRSGFGAARDGGARSHRGVDIFADRGTGALAATDGWIVRVDSTRRGGNVVWMQPLFGNMRLYYAHLDRQLVERGQFVRAGQRIGEVGNTGNAATTPPHLHFGVYLRRRGMRGGARDPYEFLN